MNNDSDLLLPNMPCTKVRRHEIFVGLREYLLYILSCYDLVPKFHVIPRHSFTMALLISKGFIYTSFPSCVSNNSFTITLQLGYTIFTSIMW